MPQTLYAVLRMAEWDAPMNGKRMTGFLPVFADYADALAIAGTDERILRISRPVKVATTTNKNSMEIAP